MRRWVLVIFVVAAVALFVSPVSSGSSLIFKGGDWNAFILNQQNSRYQAGSTINSSNVAGLHQAWFSPTVGSVTGTPTVANGNVYFDDFSGYVYSVNLASGTTNWSEQLTKISLTASITYLNGLLYVAGAIPPKCTNCAVHPEVWALSPSTGKVVWATELNSGMQSLYASPTFYNGLLYVGAGGCAGEGTNSSCRGGMFALNANTGVPVWNFTTGGTDGGASVWSTAVVDPSLNSIYFGTGYNYLVKSVETYPNPSTGFLGTFGYSYSIVSLNATSGKLNWFYQAYTNKTIAGDVDFGSTGNLFTITIGGTTHKAIGYAGKDGNYWVLDRTNGQFLAKANVYPAHQGGGMIGAPGFTFMAANSPEVFIPAYYGQNNTFGPYGIFKALVPATGVFPWQFLTPGKIIGSAAVASGVVFFGDDMGNLYGLSTKTGTVLFSKAFGAGFGINGGVTIAEGHVLVGTSVCSPGCGHASGQGVYAFDVLPTPALALTSSPSTVTFGQTTSASVTMTGGSSPTGTLTFNAYSSSACTTSSLVHSSQVTVSGDAVYSSGSWAPGATGTYYWTAFYSGDLNNNPLATTCGAAGSTVTVSSVPKVTSFTFANSPTGNDPTLRSGTITFTAVVDNFGSSAVTLSGTLTVAGTATLTCTGGNTLNLSGSVAAGATATFTMTCSYTGSAGQTADALVSASFTDVNGVLGTVSGSPASLQYSL